MGRDSMSEWKKCRLGDELEEVIDNRGRNPKEYFTKGYPVIDNYLISNTLHPDLKKVTRFICDQDYKNFIRDYLKPGDVLLTLVGNGIGNVSICQTSKCVIIQNTIGLRTKQILNSLYLYYWLKNNKELLTNFDRGAAQPSIRQTDILNISLLLPPLPEQKKVAAILSSLDDKIELNNLMNRNLEQQAQAVFREWFVDHPEKKIKKGTLSDICVYSKESVMIEILTPDTYISTENLLQNKMGIQRSASLPAVEQTTKFNTGDVVISNIRPYFKKIYYCTFTGGCSTDVLCFVPKNPRYSIYMYQVLFDDAFFDYAVSGSKGTKMPRGDKKQIMNYTIAVPSDELLTKYTKIVKPMVEQVTKNNEENKRLAASRDTLLPELMNGNILDKYYSCI
jgi:type I restriction enzyme, S subunit